MRSKVVERIKQCLKSYGYTYIEEGDKVIIHEVDVNGKPYAVGISRVFHDCYLLVAQYLPGEASRHWLGLSRVLIQRHSANRDARYEMDPSTEEIRVRAEFDEIENNFLLCATLFRKLYDIRQLMGPRGDDAANLGMCIKLRTRQLHRTAFDMYVAPFCAY